jgi:hypothetical protein
MNARKLASLLNHNKLTGMVILSLVSKEGEVSVDIASRGIGPNEMLDMLEEATNKIKTEYFPSPPK